MESHIDVLWISRRWIVILVKSLNRIQNNNNQWTKVYSFCMSVYSPHMRTLSESVTVGGLSGMAGSRICGTKQSVVSISPSSDLISCDVSS